MVSKILPRIRRGSPFKHPTKAHHGSSAVGGARSGGSGGGGTVALEVAEALEVAAEGEGVGVEAEGGEGGADVVAVDGLAALAAALVGGLGGDEGDELGHGFLHGFFGVFGDLGVWWQDLLHYSPHVGYREEPVLLSDAVFLLLPAVVAGVLRHSAAVLFVLLVD